MQQDIERPPQEVTSQRREDSPGRSALAVWLPAGLILIVCAAVLAVHWPALSAQALSVDDEDYLTENVLVQNPSWRSVRRFLTEILEPSTIGGYYQPMTMLSLMADYAIGGRPNNLMVFHRTSLVFHMANTALVIVLLYLLFGHIWIAAGVGLLFGLHPMTVETISWVGERKTLLSAFFALWCLILYVRFVRKNNWKIYIGSLAMYVLALMSKPTAVPLPALLVLLDYWPLRRLKWRNVVEKVPFFAVGVVLAIIIYVSQSRTAGVLLPGDYPSRRIGLVLCHNIIFYPYKMVWPANLSSHYAFPEQMGLSEPMVLAGVVGTCILIALLLISLRWTPAALTGWLFFFVAILPAMQIIGFSDVIASDKFAYLPSIGLLMVLASFLGWFCGGGKRLRRRIAVVIITLILALQSQGKLDQAVSHYRQALQINPNFALAYNNLGLVFWSQGKLGEAISQYRRALQLDPNYAKAHNNLANALFVQGKSDEAISHYQQALKLEPNFGEVYYNLGRMLAMKDRYNEAIEHFRKAAHLMPDWPLPLTRAAWILATHPDPSVNNPSQAVALAEQAAELTQFQNPMVLDILAAAYAAVGQFDEAVKTAQAALALASAGNADELAEQLRSRLELYRQAKPYRQPLRPPPTTRP